MSELLSSSANPSSVEDDERIIDSSNMSLPAIIEIFDVHSLQLEYKRLAEILAENQQNTHWKIRVASLSRLSQIFQQFVTKYPDESFSLLNAHRNILISQFTDRRSAVVKVACQAVDQISNILLIHLIKQPLAVSKQKLIEFQIIYRDLTEYILENLLPVLNVTIKVISENSAASFLLLSQNIAQLYIDSNDSIEPYRIMNFFIRSIQESKHAICRELSYHCLAQAIELLDNRYIAIESNVDENESKSIELDNKEREKHSIELGTETNIIKSPISNKGSILYVELEKIILAGISDSNLKARAAARLALIHFKLLSPVRHGRILLSMAPSARKLLDKQIVDLLATQIAPLAINNNNIHINANQLQSPISPNPSKDSAANNFKAFKNKLKKNINSPNNSSSNDSENISVAISATAPEATQSATDEKSSQLSESTSLIAQNINNLSNNAEALAIYERNQLLLSKLLDLENPMLTDKMIDFLLHDGVFETLVGFISRVPITFNYEEIAFNSLEPTPTAQRYDEDYMNSAEENELLATRRSYNVMQILSTQRTTQSLLSVLEKRIPSILIRLLATFHTQSKGNFYHVAAVLTKLTNLYPVAVLDCCNSKQGKILFLRMFEYLHESPVADLILTLLTAQAEKSKKNALFTQMKKHKVLDSVTEKLCSSISPQLIVSAQADFILQYIAKVSNADYLTSMLTDIGKEGGIVERLANSITSINYPDWQRKQCTNVLFELITATENREIDISDAANPQGANNPFASKRVMNPMFGLKGKVFQTLKAQIKQLTNTLLIEESKESNNTANSPAITFSSYSVSKPFSQARFALFRLISKVCLVQPSATLAIPLSAWASLIDYFFLYKHNSFYLLAFRDLFLVILHGGAEQLEVLKLILQQLHLVDKLIENYHTENKGSTLDSYILDIASHLRLTAQTPRSNDYLASFLKNHEKWQKFLPILIAESERQAHSAINAKKAQFTPQQMMERAFMGLPTEVASEESKYNTNHINLGSVFAYRLGYCDLPAAANASSVAASSNFNSGEARSAGKKKKSAKEAQNDASAAAFAPAALSSGGKKKKKNKKKKKKSSNSTAAEDESSDSEEELS
jgi:hypothetical protein